MSDMAPKRSDDSPRYVVERGAHGYLVVSRTDGEEMTHKEFVWLQNIISLSLRAERIGEQRAEFAPKDDVDEIVTFLAQQHLDRRIPFKAFAQIVGVHTTTLSELSRGRRRGYLDIVRPWAYFLGFDIVAIPRALGKAVRRLVEDYLEEHTINTSVVDEER